MNAFAALADETRRGIVILLAQRGELPVSEISKNFEMSPPAISQHLKILKEANVIKMKKQAQQRLYSVDETSLNEIESWVLDVRNIWNRRLNKLDTYLAKLKKERGSGNSQPNNHH